MTTPDYDTDFYAWTQAQAAALRAKAAPALDRDHLAEEVESLGEAERQRRWAEEDRQQALQQQVREMEEAIREEQLSDDQREWRLQYRERQAAITREARRRLGLPEENPPC
jgi:hypothetical protein